MDADSKNVGKSSGRHRVSKYVWVVGGFVTSLFLGMMWLQGRGVFVQFNTRGSGGDMDPVVRPEVETNRPIIGVLTVPVEMDDKCVTRRRMRRLSDEKEDTSCFHSPYVKWIEAAGGRVVPIPFDASLNRTVELLKHVNGVLFTGGDTPVKQIHSGYMERSRFILDYVIRENLESSYFPLWGTCMGIQTLSVLVGGPDVLEYHIFSGVDPQMMSLTFTEEAKSSKMFSRQVLPVSIEKWMKTEPVTTNFHHDGMDPESFKVNSNLSSFFRVTTTNIDKKGRPFVSTIEARDFPIYGVQWHPERPQFHFFRTAAEDPVNHDIAAVQVNAWTASFFINEARRNARHFPTAEEEEAALIYNHVPRGKTANQIYYF
uniref:folate gamma-glutamyl hydrolase n=1 Tax=Mucochytrium quahogii TaxID=96639 RepID=A0A7S2RTC8_9STRA|mmetsp:Transcript_1982/g.2948  ORF Transcript_1982/g.2948 Transcript_1982/m.2948 type:complete len:372 (+) Transcript_1982:359-1474(+)